MKFLGGLVKYILNINTIWGFMILTAFVACLLHQHLPTTLVIPGDRLQTGTNTLTIQIDAAGGESRAFDYPLTFGPQGLVVPSDRPESKDQPWFISARQIGGGYLLKWDAEGHGEYQVLLNEEFLSSGSLVTLASLTDAAFTYAQSAFDIALGLVATMVLFLGLMKVGEDAGIVQLAARVFYPIIRFLFPQVPKEHPANGAILMNMTTSILGLGNAATPFGLKAMKELQSLNPNPDVATDAQVMLLAYNTAGLALIPTTLLAVRKSAGCSDPFEIIGTCLVTGLISTITALTMAKLLPKLPFFSLRAALADGAETASDAESVKTLPEKQVAAVAGSEEKGS